MGFPANGSSDSKPFKFLIYGRTGWIGGLLGKICEAQGIDYSYGCGRLENRTSIEGDIAAVKPTHVFNAAGVTGRPNVDWCESHKVETIRTNVVGTLTLADVCREKGLIVINYATGCIFEYDAAHPLGSGIGFKEEDTPNFIGSYYSKTKAMVEDLLKNYENVCTLRVSFTLVRESSVSDPVKGKLIESFKSYGVTLIYGDMYDDEGLVKALKLVDVVISTVGFVQIADQAKIISAIKEAGNIKRFIPSEFGNDEDRTHAVEPAKSAFAIKSRLRRAIEAEGIPYTYVVTGCFAGYFLPSLAQPGATAPPRDKAIIMGDGTPKAVFNEEHDIGMYTIKAVDDPRTLNKTLYIKPPNNIYSFNQLVSLWEKKIGKAIEKIYLPEEQVLKQIEESPIPLNLKLSISHSVFVCGDQTNFEIEPSFGVEASQLYPDVKYTTVDEYLRHFV